MKKVEFIIIFQVVLAFNLVYDAGKNTENCQWFRLNSVTRLSDLCNCMVDAFMDSQRQLATAKTHIESLSGANQEFLDS